MRQILAVLTCTLALTVVVGYRSPKLSNPAYTPTTVAKVLANNSLKSTDGKNLVFHSVKATGKELYRFYIQGGLHGNELATPRFVEWLIIRLEKGQGPLVPILKKATFDFVPRANPDGLEHVHRYNARGVNLNRNFGVLWGASREDPGEAAFSEPETRAIRALFEKRKYDAAADIHGYINWIVAPSRPATIARLGTSIDVSKRLKEYRKWYQAMDQEMALLPNYELHTAGGLGDGGAFEDWAFWKGNALSFCLELQDDKQFGKPYRRTFADISQESVGKIDKFKRYEFYLARMFNHAMTIRAPRAKTDLADN